MISHFAFFGTGPCDPNKGLYQLLVFAGTLIGWIILVALIRKLNRSTKSKAVKTNLSILLVLFGVIGTAITFFATWVALACSG